MFNDKIPFNSTMLAQVTRHTIGNVEKAIQIFRDLNLIEVLDNGAIYLADIQNFIGSSSTEADRKRFYRQRIDKEKAELLPAGQMSDKCPDKNPPEIELEKEIDIELQIKKDITPSEKPPKAKPVRHKYGDYQNVLLSDQDMEKLQAEFPNDWQDRIERLSEYMASTGKSYKSHLATIRNWAKRDNNKPRLGTGYQKPGRTEKLPEWAINQQKQDRKLGEAERKALTERIRRLSNAEEEKE